MTGLPAAFVPVTTRRNMAHVLWFRNSDPAAGAKSGAEGSDGARVTRWLVLPRTAVGRRRKPAPELGRAARACAPRPRRPGRRRPQGGFRLARSGTAAAA